MKTKIILFVWSLMFASALGVAASSGPSPSASLTASAAKPQTHSEDTSDFRRLEGERRFHANCGRCHAAPQKFPPRMMATIVRHMRVRATITDEDMRSILFYMTQ
jgi:mono/diheme cytochrome c family protein